MSDDPVETRFLAGGRVAGWLVGTKRRPARPPVLLHALLCFALCTVFSSVSSPVYCTRMMRHCCTCTVLYMYYCTTDTAVHVLYSTVQYSQRVQCAVLVYLPACSELGFLFPTFDAPQVARPVLQRTLAIIRPKAYAQYKGVCVYVPLVWHCVCDWD